MADTGAKVPTGATTTNEDPWLDEAWQSPANIYGAGEASVTAATFDNNDQTGVLKAYGFDFSAIGDTDEILGVVVTINARADSVNVGIDLVQLLDVSRAKVGTNNSNTAQRLAVAASDYNFGAADDLWGNALTPAWVKDPDFGVAIGGHAYTANSQIWIDSVTMTVYYQVHDTTPDRFPSENVGVTDVLAYVKSMARTGVENAGVTDSVFITYTPEGEPQNYEDYLFESEGVSDSVYRSMNIKRNTVS